MAMADNLNAQQVALVNEELTKRTKQIIDQMNLRKWAMDAALQRTTLDQTQSVAFATAIYDFIVSDAGESTRR